MLTNAIETALQTELLPGERLLWSGQPRQGYKLRWSDAFMIPFSLLWGGMVILGVASAALSGLMGRAAPLLVLSVPFVLMALYVTVGRFAVEAYARRRTYYGLTNQRLLIASGIFRRHLRALNLRTLTEVQVSVGRHGRGTLGFGSAPWHPFVVMSAMFWQGAGSNLPPAFEDIEQPRAVYEQIHAAQARLLERG